MFHHKAPPTNKRIKHVVVLCLENRSFDNLLGWWARERQNGAEGVPEGGSNTCTATGQTFYATNKAGYMQENDPIHQVEGVAQQIYGSSKVSVMSPGSASSSMSGFVDASADAWKTTKPEALQEIMDGFAPETMPITTALADNFAVFDHWYSALPGPTIPNRLFLLSATSNGMTKNEAKLMAAGFPQRSIFQHLEDSNRTWKNYHGGIPTSLLFKDARELGDIFTKIHTMEHFYTDAAKGHLAEFSWIDPVLFSGPAAFANDNHPPHDCARGELLVKHIYEALRNGPLWEQTLFLITYDEHGGFYDHVAPPTQGVPSPDKASENSPVFKFNRLGVRVPTIAISPWVKKQIIKTPPPHAAPTPTSQFEHCSLSATLKNYFNLPDFLNTRDAWAATFDYLTEEGNGLDRPRSDCPAKLPNAPEISLKMIKSDVEIEYKGLADTFHSLFHGLTP